MSHLTGPHYSTAGYVLVTRNLPAIVPPGILLDLPETGVIFWLYANAGRHYRRRARCRLQASFREVA